MKTTTFLLLFLIHDIISNINDIMISVINNIINDIISSINNITEQLYDKLTGCNFARLYA